MANLTVFQDVIKRNKEGVKQKKLSRVTNFRNANAQLNKMLL